MTKVVRFTKPFSVYAEGDIAGLTEEVAKAAFEAEAAVPYKAEKETAKEEKEETKKEETEETKSVDSPVVDKMAKNAPVKK